MCFNAQSFYPCAIMLEASLESSNPVLSHHISSQFNEDLQDVNTKFMTMGGLVEQQVANAIHSLLDTDANLAIDVQFKDNAVNQYERDIDEGLTLILARRHPAAIDLRMVIAMSKANTDLERIGDEAAKLPVLHKIYVKRAVLLVVTWKHVILVTKYGS